MLPVIHENDNNLKKHKVNWLTTAFDHKLRGLHTFAWHAIIAIKHQQTTHLITNARNGLALFVPLYTYLGRIGYLWLFGLLKGLEHEGTETAACNAFTLGLLMYRHFEKVIQVKSFVRVPWCSGTCFYHGGNAKVKDILVTSILTFECTLSLAHFDIVALHWYHKVLRRSRIAAAQYTAVQDVVQVILGKNWHR